MANYLILIYFLYEILSKLNFVILIVIEEIKNSKKFKKLVLIQELEIKLVPYN